MKSKSAVIAVSEINPIFLTLALYTKKFSMFFFNTIENLHNPSLSSKISRLLTGFGGRGGGNSIKKMIPLATLAVIIIAVLFLVVRFLQTASSTSPVVRGSDSRVDLKPARAKQVLNKIYLFPIKDDKGKEFTKLKFNLESAEVRDEIILNGQKAVSVKGRTYFIVTIELTNSTDKYINIRLRDFVRFDVNKDEKWVAAEIYNDPVEVQPQSTKTTRLGFAINDTDKNLMLRVGELTGKKDTIPLNLSF